jgi:hypothetical protein
MSAARISLSPVVGGLKYTKGWPAPQLVIRPG